MPHSTDVQPQIWSNMGQPEITTLIDPTDICSEVALQQMRELGSIKWNNYYDDPSILQILWIFVQRALLTQFLQVPMIAFASSAEAPWNCLGARLIRTATMQNICQRHWIPVMSRRFGFVYIVLRGSGISHLILRRVILHPFQVRHKSIGLTNSTNKC